MNEQQHEFLEEIAAFNPKWQDKYHTIAEAALAANCLDLYAAWLKTEKGKAYKATMIGVPDTIMRIKKEQEMEANSALPFKRATFGTAFRRSLTDDTLPEELDSEDTE